MPVVAVLMQAAWACVLAASGTYDQLTDYVIFAAWIFYGLVTSAVFVLRRRAPDLPRPYRTLGYPVVPLVFVLVAIWLVVNTLVNRPVESVTGLVLIALGLPVYWYFRGSLTLTDTGLIRIRVWLMPSGISIAVGTYLTQLKSGVRFRRAASQFMTTVSGAEFSSSALRLTRKR